MKCSRAGVPMCCTMKTFGTFRSPLHNQSWETDIKIPLNKNNVAIATFWNNAIHKLYYDEIKKNFKIICQTPVRDGNHGKVFTIIFENKK